MEPPDIELRGVEPWFVFGWPVPHAVAEAFAAGLLDDVRIAGLLDALVLLAWEWTSPAPLAAEAAPVAAVPARQLLAPFHSARSINVRRRMLVGGKVRTAVAVRLRPEPGWGALLAADRAVDVARGAIRRLRVAGLRPAVDDAATLTAAVRGPQLAAALLLQTTSRSYERDLLSVIVEPVEEHVT